MKHISDEGIALIHSFESLELVAYPDPNSPLGTACARAGLPMRSYRKVPKWASLSAKPWTIGWGHTGSDVFEGLVWSQEIADRTFEADISRFEVGVNSLVKVPVTQGQFDALVSFAYNVGLDIDDDTKAEGLGDSTLLRKLNARDYDGAAKQFLLWVSKGTASEKGLTRRRKTEVERFYGRPWRGVK